MDSPPGRVHLLDPAGAFAALTAVLWNEREALDRVLFKVVQERLVLEAPALRWLAKVDEELIQAVRAMRERAAERVEAVAELAAVLELHPRCRLADLVTIAPEPWPAILADHRTALRVLVRDLTAETASARRRLRSSGDAVRDSLDELHARSGMTDVLDDFRAVDRELAVTAADFSHRSALRTVSAVVDRPLLDFLA